MTGGVLLNATRCLFCLLCENFREKSPWRSIPRCHVHREVRIETLRASSRAPASGLSFGFATVVRHPTVTTCNVYEKEWFAFDRRFAPDCTSSTEPAAQNNYRNGFKISGMPLWLLWGITRKMAAGRSSVSLPWRRDPYNGSGDRSLMQMPLAQNAAVDTCSACAFVSLIVFKEPVPGCFCEIKIQACQNRNPIASHADSKKSTLGSTCVLRVLGKSQRAWSQLHALLQCHMWEAS